MDIILNSTTVIELLCMDNLKTKIKKYLSIIKAVKDISSLILSKNVTTEEIRKNFEVVSKMKSLGLADYNILEKYRPKYKAQNKNTNGTMLDDAIHQYFDDIGPIVVNGLYGKFKLDEKSSVNMATHHFNNKMGHAISQIKNVLENGKALYYEKKFKNRIYDRLLIAAPIEIKTKEMKTPKECIMGIAVNINKDNKRLNNMDIYIIEEGQALNSSSMISKEPSNNEVARPSIVTLLQQVVEVKNGTRDLEQVTAIGIDSD